MRVVAIDVRLAGPRPYENGMIDVGAVAYEGGEEIASYYSVFKPDRYRAYRPDMLQLAGMDFDRMQREGENAGDVAEMIALFMDNYRRGAAVWCFESHTQGDFLGRAMRSVNREIDSLTDILSLWQVAKALGVRNEHGGVVPSMDCKLSILNYFGFEVEDFNSEDALVRAKMSAAVTLKILEGVRDHVRGKPEEKRPVLEVAG